MILLAVFGPPSSQCPVEVQAIPLRRHQFGFKGEETMRVDILQQIDQAPNSTLIERDFESSKNNQSMMSRMSYMRGEGD